MPPLASPLPEGIGKRTEATLRRNREKGGRGVGTYSLREPYTQKYYPRGLGLFQKKPYRGGTSGRV